MSSSPRKRPITGSTDPQQLARPVYLQPRVVLIWAVTVAWAGNITFLSTASFSGSVTGWLLQQIISSLHIHLAHHTFEIVHSLTRKLAHCTEYGIFSLLLYHSFTFRRLESWNTRSAISAVVVAGLFSLTDEYHQSFVPGRTASIKDCGLDTFGALLGMLLLYAGRRLQASRSKVAATNESMAETKKGAAGE
jgi:VanZ family protein